MTTMKTAKFVKAGESTSEIGVSNGTSIRDAAKKAGMEINETKETVYVLDEDTDEMDDDPCDLDDVVETGSYAIVPQTESN